MNHDTSTTCVYKVLHSFFLDDERHYDTLVTAYDLAQAKRNYYSLVNSMPQASLLLVREVTTTEVISEN